MVVGRACKPRLAAGSASFHALFWVEVIQGKGCRTNVRGVGDVLLCPFTHWAVAACKAASSLTASSTWERWPWQLMESSWARVYDTPPPTPFRFPGHVP